jgi:hypothetical protein
VLHKFIEISRTGVFCLLSVPAGFKSTLEVDNNIYCCVCNYHVIYGQWGGDLPGIFHLNEMLQTVFYRFFSHSPTCQKLTFHLKTRLPLTSDGFGRMSG